MGSRIGVRLVPVYDMDMITVAQVTLLLEGPEACRDAERLMTPNGTWELGVFPGTQCCPRIPSKLPAVPG